ncbi:hypothetical protein GCM10023160_02340 [Brachybacterium paraconglomeratum]
MFCSDADDGAVPSLLTRPAVAETPWVCAPHRTGHSGFVQGLHGRYLVTMPLVQSGCPPLMRQPATTQTGSLEGLESVLARIRPSAS